MKRILRGILLIMVIAALLFVAGSWIFAVKLTDARPSATGDPPLDFPYPVESITFTTSDEQTLSGWLVPAPGSRGIVLLHGYGGNRKQMLPRARFFRAQGCTVLLYDARACGESSGDQISFGYHERHDVIAAVKLLKERGCTDIACLGVSQGGATILFAADELPELKCVICESVYDEMEHAVDGRLRHYTYIPGWIGASLVVPFAENRLELSIDDIKPVDHIGKLRCPVLVISGECDDKTTPADTRRLFDAANEPKELWLIPDARHEDLFRFVGYEERLDTFVKRHLLIERK